MTCQKYQSDGGYAESAGYSCSAMEGSANNFVTLFLKSNELHTQRTPATCEQTIERQGEDAHCAAWIYTKEDVCNITDDGDEVYPCEDNPELTERILMKLATLITFTQ